MKIPYRLLLASLTAWFATPSHAGPLVLRENPETGTISVHRAGESRAVLTQNVRPDFRPYIHPIVAPDGKGVLTEFSPDHHTHQTGLFWGLTNVNGRDYFHNPGNGYWRRVAGEAMVREGDEVTWKTVYELLDAAGGPVMLETQLWAMREAGGRYVLDLEWTGAAHQEITVGAADYGGLFLRMPWREGIEGSVVNSARQSDQRANGQRAVWLDIGMKVEGRDDQAHFALFDHPTNDGYPLPWRVDAKMGVGPSRAILGDWKIAKGQIATYRHQFIVYTGRLDDVALYDDWRTFSGERNDSAQWQLAKAEAKNAVFLTGEEAAAKMSVPAGLEVQLFAAEPDVTQPIAFCWDDRGRLWVAENRDYETRRTGFSGSGDSRILILEDVDGDGKMDTRKVFLDGVPFPSAIAWGFGGLWLGAPPNLLFVPDRNGDDRADPEIEVRLTGWGIQDRHEVLNSLNWGPDGWLYGCQGFATRSNVGKPLDGGRVFRKGDAFPSNVAVKDGQKIDGGVWRYHPVKDRFEVVAHGFSNPWGLDFDDHGQLFITACVIPHLWHVIPGGIYHRQGGTHMNPHVYADIRTIADHRHQSAHGGARFYLADEFPAKYRGRIFMANIHEHAVLTDILEPRGSGFVGHHGDEPLLANDPQWIGFSMETGPDGAVYVLDWHDADICGQSIHDKDTGRVFRLAPKGLPTKFGFDLARASDLELVAHQLNRNDWYVRRARLLLHQRATEGRLDGGVHAALWRMFEEQEDTGRKLRALWALHVTGGLAAERLVALLEHAAPYVRGWTIQLLCEDRAPGARALAKFAVMARSDPSPIVRLYLAAALQRIPHAHSWAVAEGLVGHAADADDHNLPKMIWFGVEPLVMEDTPRALTLATRGKLPLVTQFVARRATAGEQLEPLTAIIAKTSDAVIRRLLLEGMRDGLAQMGRRAITAPVNWAPVERDLLNAKDDTTRDLALQIGQFFGSAQAAAAQLAILRDRDTPVERRREVLQSMMHDAYEPALPVILDVLGEEPLRRDAIRALVSFNDPRVATTLLERYSGWSAAEKADAIQTLVSRRSTAEQLLEAMKQGVIPKKDVSAFAARQMRRVLGPEFVDYWGSMNELPGEKKATELKYRRLLTDEALAGANVANGRVTFDRTCGACHTMYGTGGTIGPDLTGSNRANLDYILAEILHPSEVIQEGYQLVTLTTRDGRTLGGTIAAENAQQITLRQIGQETVVPKSEILSREKSPVSMMPEGLLSTLPDEKVVELIAYLRTTKQVPPPKQ